MWDLIVSAPDHCLFFYLKIAQKHISFVGRYFLSIYKTKRILNLIQWVMVLVSDYRSDVSPANKQVQIQGKYIYKWAFDLND